MSLTLSAQEIPNWFHGEWKGTIVQNFPDGQRESYSVHIEHKDDYFRITSESHYYKCIGMWKIKTSNEYEIVFDQIITLDAEDNRCAKNTNVKVFAEDGTIHYLAEGKVIGECKGVLKLVSKTEAEF